MAIRRTLGLTALAVSLTACGTPTVTTSPDTSAQEAAISAPSGAPTVGPSTQTAKLGEAITLTGLDDLKLALKPIKVFPSAQSASEGISAGDGREFYGVQLILKNVGTTAYDGSPDSSAVVIDSEGQQFRPILADIKNGVSFTHSTVSPNDVRKGMVVFAVSKGAHITKVQFSVEGGDADQTGEWTIP